MAPQSNRISRRHHEIHRTGRSGWLRAVVLGANDGILSTGALLLGVVSAGGSRSVVLTAGIAGVTAGAASMAMGEFVSVSSQKDAQSADRATEEWEIAVDPVGEHAELRGIYVERGLTPQLADQVATQLMETNPVEAHLRDELGLTDSLRARPMQAAVSSFFSFLVGALVPMLAATLATGSTRGSAVALCTMVGLLALGALGARLGGASMARGSLRVGIGGALALGLTFGVGALVGTAIG